MNLQLKLVLALCLLTIQSLVISQPTMADVSMNHIPTRSLHKRIPGKAPRLVDPSDSHYEEDIETSTISKSK
ncbi:hypothetical protein H0X48_00230 [Candidatus Dependentiae bacterium]|nr:hypothetical protein [Candidatus Dependentiae bacterium]